MADGGQAESAANSGVIEQRGGTASDMGIPKSTVDGPTKKGAVGGRISGSSDDGRTDQGSVGEDVTVALDGIDGNYPLSITL